jgi:hypothetical protein
MNGRCRQIQHILAESGATAFQDDATAQQHLADCADCYAVLTALSELDAAVGAMPIHDASDECVDSLFARIRDLPQPEPEVIGGMERIGRRLRTALESASDWHARVLASAAVVAVVSAACVAIVYWMVDLDTNVVAVADRSATEAHFALLKDEEGVSQPSNESVFETKKRSMPSTRERVAADLAPGQEPLRSLGYSDGGEPSAERSDSEWRGQPGTVIAANAQPSLAMQNPDDDIEEILVHGVKTSKRQDAPTSSTSFNSGDLEALRVGDIADVTDFAPNLEIRSSFEAGKEAPTEPATPAKSTQVLARASKNAEAKRTGAEPRLTDDAFAGFAFQEASGYWSNAYVPGDPAIRLLESRLNAADREMLEAASATPLQLHDRARRVQQPFDAPTEAAMEVFLHSDRTALEGPERLTLQVGLQGARRQGGIRPPMNIGIVLDLRGEISAESATQMRAIVDAFRTAKQIGDQFSLRIAGRNCAGVEPDRFEYGPLSVAMEACFGADAAPGDGQGLAAAFESAAHAVRASDDPDAPLGSSMVMLVTSQSIASDLDALDAIGHASAVAGVPISVAGVGAGIALDEIDQLTLAGQGNRRLVTTPDEARAAVDRELSALGRAVARALRLQIRLAPSVKLIRILDSSRLDEEGAERVRETEQSIDLRMANDLGIEVDRGEDEDGIQIVIPSFYAGDSHAILLDVVAREAGPIAEATLRYKDLIYQRNGVARANLELGAEAKTAGPLERNVVKNVLTVRMSSALKDAGRALEDGRVDGAARILDDQRDRTIQLRASEAAFQGDAELKVDLDLLDEYLSLLHGGAVGLEGPRRYLATSLQLSGYFKTLPRTRAD